MPLSFYGTVLRSEREALRSGFGGDSSRAGVCHDHGFNNFRFKRGLPPRTSFTKEPWVINAWDLMTSGPVAVEWPPTGE